MCGTMPSGHWCANSVSISVQARSSSKWRWPSAVRQRIPVPLERVEALGRHGVAAAVVLPQDGDRALGRSSVVGHRSALVVSGSNQRMRSACGTSADGVAGRDGGVGVEDGAEQAAVDVGGDEGVRAERLDDADARPGCRPRRAPCPRGGCANSMRSCAARRGRGSSWPATRHWPGPAALGGEEVHRRVADEASRRSGRPGCGRPRPGASAWTMRPSFITAIRSASDIASTWSWVT